MKTNLIEISGTVVSQESRFTSIKIDDSTFIIPNSSIQLKNNKKIFINKNSILFQVIENQNNKPIVWGNGFLYSQGTTIYDDCHGDCDCRCECRCDCSDCDCRCECRCDCQGGKLNIIDSEKDDKIRKKTTVANLDHEI